MTENTLAQSDHASSFWTAGLPLSFPIVSGISMGVDALCVAASGAICYWLVIGGSEGSGQSYLAGILLSPLVVVGTAYALRLYDFGVLLEPVRNLHKLALVFAISLLLLLATAYALDISHHFSPSWFMPFASYAVISIIVMRIASSYTLYHLCDMGILTRRVAIVGAGEQAQRLLSQMQRIRPHINSVVGVYDDRLNRSTSQVAGYPVLGNIDSLMAFARINRIDDIIVALPWSADERLMSIFNRLRELPVEIHLGSDMVGFQLPRWTTSSLLSGVPLLEIADRPLSGWKQISKAIEDKILAGLLTIFFAPLMLLVALAIRLESPGPVIYRQKRYGFNNQVFYIYKFRSMWDESSTSDDSQQAKRDDPRTTRVGRILRRTSLDELPQLFNVLNGTMSLVGPRPHTVYHNKEYALLIDGYNARHRVKPGITGWAQICGLRGETDTVDKMEARVRYDVYYVENWSLLFDLQILAITLFLGLTNKNAY